MTFLDFCLEKIQTPTYDIFFKKNLSKMKNDCIFHIYLKKFPPKKTHFQKRPQNTQNILKIISRPKKPEKNMTLSKSTFYGIKW